MKGKIVFFLILGFSLLFPIKGFVQTLGEEYDRREAIIDPFEQEDKELEEKKINEIISRIKAGDKAVLRLIVFETLQKVHDKISQEEKQTGKNYFELMGGQNVLPAIVGGFDNQDPKVRLKMIGYLGHWVEEMGKNLNYIEREVEKRMQSNIETRKEVRYAFRLLKMKIVRKSVVSSIKSGNQKSLVRISPEEFLPLVYYEPRIRTIYLGSSSAVKIRSIVLDEGVQPETGELVGRSKGRHPGLDIEKICYRGVKTYSYQSEVAQWSEANVGSQKLTSQAVGVGGEKDYAKVSQVSSRSSLDWECVKAIYTGIDNKSQFVREHAARIFLNYIRGYTGDVNYVGSVKGATRVPEEDLVKMSQEPYYIRIAQVAWDNIKWSEFSYNDRIVSDSNLPEFIKSKFYMEYEYSEGKKSSTVYRPPVTSRYFTKDATTYPEWGTELTGNYRNDIKEILRVLGQSYYLDPEYVPKEATVQYYQSRVSSLFNDENAPSRVSYPDSSDMLEGESQVPVAYSDKKSSSSEGSSEMPQSESMSSSSSSEPETQGESMSSESSEESAG